MAVDLLQYQGNAGLGAGANGGIAVPETVDLKEINSAVRDIMLQDNQMNVLKWKQNIEDRNKLFTLIQSGQTAAGDILPEYRPMFDRYKKKVEDYFQEHGQDLIRDPEKMSVYKGLVNDLNDTSAHAQTNSVQINKLKQDKANATLKVDQDRIQKHIDAQLGRKFWDSVDPYQKMNSFSIDAVTKAPPLRKTVERDPSNPLYSYDTEVADYDDILRFKQNQFINDKTGEDADSIDQFYDKMQGYDPIALGKALSGIDNRIKEYNKARGFKKGQPGYVDEVQREVRNGQLLLKEPKADFAAKYALANLPTYKTSTPKFNDKEGSYMIAKQRADTEAVYKRILAQNTGARTRAYVDNVKSQIAARKKPEDQAQFMDEMYNRNLLNQSSLIQSRPGGKVGFNSIPADQSLPVLTLDGGKVTKLIPIGAKAIKDKSGKVLRYEGGYYEPQYRMDGKSLNVQQLSEQYSEFKKSADSKSPGAPTSFDAFLKMGIQGGVFDFLIKGANGTVDRKLSVATQRAISNQNTSKGEDAIFEPMDEQVPDSQTPIE